MLLARGVSPWERMQCPLKPRPGRQKTLSPLTGLDDNCQTQTSRGLRPWLITFAPAGAYLFRGRPNRRLEPKKGLLHDNAIHMVPVR